MYIYKNLLFSFIFFILYLLHLHPLLNSFLHLTFFLWKYHISSIFILVSSQESWIFTKWLVLGQDLRKFLQLKSTFWLSDCKVYSRYITKGNIDNVSIDGSYISHFLFVSAVTEMLIIIIHFFRRSVLSRKDPRYDYNMFLTLETGWNKSLKTLLKLN